MGGNWSKWLNQDLIVSQTHVLIFHSQGLSWHLDTYCWLVPLSFMHCRPDFIRKTFFDCICEQAMQRTFSYDSPDSICERGFNIEALISALRYQRVVLNSVVSHAPYLFPLPCVGVKSFIIIFCLPPVCQMQIDPPFLTLFNQYHP